MNEPKKDTIIEAAMKRWPNAVNIQINQRKHEMLLTVKIKAESHRELLELIEKVPVTLPVEVPVA